MTIHWEALAAVALVSLVVGVLVVVLVSLAVVGLSLASPTWQASHQERRSSSVAAGAACHAHGHAGGGSRLIGAATIVLYGPGSSSRPTPGSTAIYAKVDTARLRDAARPWPGRR